MREQTDKIAAVGLIALAKLKTWKIKTEIAGIECLKHISQSH